MSKNLKLGQIVNVFEDGKFFRASKAIVVKVESGCIHLDCRSPWVEERSIRKFKRYSKISFYNSVTNLFFQPRTLKSQWLDSVGRNSEACYEGYLQDDKTLLDFEEWYDLRGDG